MTASDPAAAPGESGARSVQGLIEAGITAAGEGRFDEAKATFEQALQSDPDNKYAWFNLGFLAQTHKDAAGAMKNYDKALASDPSYTPAMYNKAILLESKDPDAAINLYRSILDINDKASTALFRLATLLDKKGDENSARSAFTRAVKLDPGLADAVPSAYRP